MTDGPPPPDPALPTPAAPAPGDAGPDMAPPRRERPPTDPDRTAREAAALRDNLRRRKDQARARRGEG